MKMIQSRPILLFSLSLFLYLYFFTNSLYHISPLRTTHNKHDQLYLPHAPRPKPAAFQPSICPMKLRLHRKHEILRAINRKELHKPEEAERLRGMSERQAIYHTGGQAREQ